MAVFELYSKRKKKIENAGKVEPYSYDDIPVTFRRQVVHIWNDQIGEWGRDLYGDGLPQNKLWKYLHDTLAREYGEFFLAKGYNEDEKLQEFFLTVKNIDKVIDVIELSFKLMGSKVPREVGVHWIKSKEAIQELNARFEEHAIGFEFVNNEIIRKDSQFIHAEITKKALELLFESGFQGASEEFLKAHKHYREGSFKEAVNDSLKSFESTMKTICSKRGWEYNTGDSAKKLIQIMLDKNLVPNFLETHMSGVRNTLEAGLPVVRNKNSGHGQGEIAVEIPRSLAQYSLNLAATNIVFLVERFREIK